MSIAPKIIYLCNHVIVDKDKEYGDIQMTRNENLGFPDKVSANIDILRVDEVMDKTKSITYSPGIDYEQKVSNNILEWVNFDTKSNLPKCGDTYYIRGSYVKTVTRKAEEDICERCGNNGWYVDIMGQDGSEIVTGADKLAQDFIKLIFTEKANGYGSSISDVLAQNIYNETELGLNISSAIEDCQNQMIKSQLELINNNITIPLSEALDSIEVKEILFVKEDCACYISIMLINKMNESIDFSFMI